MQSAPRPAQAESELVAAEESFRVVLDSIQDSYFEADPHGVVTWANRAFCDNLGLSGREDVVGRNFRRFTAPRSIRTLYSEFSKLYATGAPVPRFEYFFRTNDGSARPGEASISPIMRDGRIVGSRGLIRDVSARLTTEARLHDAIASAEARAAELGAINRVAAKVSRTLDLNSVLQSVCEELTSIFPVRNAGVGLITPDGRSLEVVAFHTPDPNEKSAIGMLLPFKGNPSSQEVIRRKRPLVIQDAQTDPRTGAMSDISRARGTRAIMIVPIMTRGEAIGTIGMPATDPFYVFSQNEVELAETIASQIAAAIDNAQLHTQTEISLDIAERDLEIGRQIQGGFFPAELPRIPGWEIAADFKAARQVAGDFYDVIQIQGTPYTAFVIADVCDKGVGAALFMVLFRSLLRAYSEQVVPDSSLDDQLLRIVRSTNNFVAEYHGRSNMFATVFIGILDPETGDLYYVNGGHEPPVVLDTAGTITTRLAPTGPAVGMFPDVAFTVARHRLDHGDCVVGFTDGTTDAKDHSGRLFTEDRLLRCLANPWTSIFSMLFELDIEIRAHIGTRAQFDDITLLALRRKGATHESLHAICRVAETAALPELREFVESAAAYSGLGRDDVFAFKSAADELCTNVVQHGYEGRTPGLLSVSLHVEPGVLARLVITDDGIHFDPESAAEPDPTLGIAERNPGGLGIYLARAQMDALRYTRTHDGANRLVLEKSLRPGNNKEGAASGDPRQRD